MAAGVVKASLPPAALVPKDLNEMPEFFIDLDQPVSFFPALVSYVGTAIVPYGEEHTIEPPTPVLDLS